MSEKDELEPQSAVEEPADIPPVDPGPPEDPASAADMVLSPGSASPSPPAPPGIADGVERSLDPRTISLHRISGAIITGVLALAQLIVLLIVKVATEMAGWGVGLALLGWVVVSSGLGWALQIWPALHYKHSAYRVTKERLEIRTGVWWRTVTSIPRSRIQHTDVAQGPLQRQLGLAKLVIHTAGTDNAMVVLNGVAHETALQIRDHLVAGGPDDAV